MKANCHLSPTWALAVCSSVTLKDSVLFTKPRCTMPFMAHMLIPSVATSVSPWPGSYNDTLFLS